MIESLIYSQNILFVPVKCQTLLRHRGPPGVSLFHLPDMAVNPKGDAQ